MPPELLNDGILSKAADVYAFGVLLYEMFTTKQVWEGLRHPQIIHAIAVQKKHPEFPNSAPNCYKVRPAASSTFKFAIYEKSNQCLT